MAEDITAPIDISPDIASLEEFRRALRWNKVVSVTLDRRDGLVVLTKDGVDIVIAPRHVGFDTAQATRLTEEILGYIGIPAPLIDKMQRRGLEGGRKHYLWMPVVPIAVTFLDKLLGRRRQEWQFVTVKLPR